MPWTTNELEYLTNEARSLTYHELKALNLKIDCPVFIADEIEMRLAIIEELNHLDYPESSLKRIRDLYIPFVLGKYFTLKHEIWLLHGRGESIPTIVHELLHSIQKCDPNREGIVNYLTYKITDDTQVINSYELSDWQEIEKTNFYEQIKLRLVTKGDCEDF